MIATKKRTSWKRPSFEKLPDMKPGPLMKQLRKPSPRGFTGLPADHVDAPRFDPDSTREAEMLAIVYGATFHEGHRRPYACHQDGSPITLEWVHDEMRQPISLDMVQRYAKRLETKGYWETECHVFYPRGTIDLSALKIIDLEKLEGEEMAKPVGMRIPKNPLPGAVRAYLKEHPEMVEKVFERWAKHREVFDAKRAALDATFREEDIRVFESTIRQDGIDVKLGGAKRVKERPWIVDVRFIELAHAGEATPQNRNAHSENEGMRTPQNGSAHPPTSLYGFSEEYQSTDTTPPFSDPSAFTSRTSSSSSSSVPSEDQETTHAMGLRPRIPTTHDPKAKGPINERNFCSLVATLCRAAGIVGTPDPSQAKELYQILPAAGRREWLNRSFAKATGVNKGKWKTVGVLSRDAKSFRDVEWPEELKRIQAQQKAAEGEAKKQAAAAATAELMKPYYTYLDNLEERLTAEATPADRAKARAKAEAGFAAGMWQTGITEDRREIETLKALRAMMRERGQKFDEWQKERSKGA